MSDGSGRSTEVSLEEWLSGWDAGFDADSRQRVRGRVMSGVPAYAGPLRSAKVLFRRSAAAFAVTATMLSGMSYAAARSNPGDLLYPVRVAAIQAREALHGEGDAFTGGQTPEGEPGASATTSPTVVPAKELTEEQLRLREHREFREATSGQPVTGEGSDTSSGSGAGPHGSDGSGSGSGGDGGQGPQEPAGGGQSVAPGKDTGQDGIGSGSGSSGGAGEQSGQGESPNEGGTQNPDGPAGDEQSQDEEEQRQRNSDRDQSQGGELQSLE